MITDSVDDISGAIGIGHGTFERFSGFTQVGRLLVQKIHGRAGIVARSGNRLGYFMRD
jgi:hypothetical protein